MIVTILQIVLRFFVLVALQVLILNNIQLGGIINPYLYVLFLLTLPVQTPKVLLLFVGFRWFLVYASVLVFVHHFIIFNLEIFRFSDFWSTQLRVLYSSIFTLVLIILSQYLLYKPEK